MITVYLCLSINTPDLLLFHLQLPNCWMHTQGHIKPHIMQHTLTHSYTLLLLSGWTPTAKRLMKQQRFTSHDDATHILRCCARQRVVALCVMAMRSCWVKVCVWVCVGGRTKQKGKEKAMVWNILVVEKRLKLTPVNSIFLLNFQKYFFFFFY